MRDIQDDLSKTDNGWNFLRDHRNQDTLPPVHGQLILRRILEKPRLMQRFVFLDQSGTATWRSKEVNSFLDLIDAFLVRVLLLMHLTPGQPARGTELVSLRHSNLVVENLLGLEIQRQISTPRLISMDS